MAGRAYCRHQFLAKAAETSRMRTARSALLANHLSFGRGRYWPLLPEAVCLKTVAMTAHATLESAGKAEGLPQRRAFVVRARLSIRAPPIPDVARFSASHALGLDLPPSLLARADEVIE
jgi:hypothetical protein